MEEGGICGSSKRMIGLGVQWLKEDVLKETAGERGCERAVEQCTRIRGRNGSAYARKTVEVNFY